VWIAFGGKYGSGLPTQFDSAQPNAIANAVAQYGQTVVNRVNFAHDRVRPSLSLDASTGIDLWKKDARALRLAANIENLNNRLNVIDFAGLFSGNAIAPPRSYSVRFQTTF
jgi:outer membrane receptor for Fe3+-dicitrate